MSTLSERLTLALEKAGITKTDLYKGAGVSSGAVSQWFSGAVKGLRADTNVKAAKVLGVNPEWLATGKGNMYLEDGETHPTAQRFMDEAMYKKYKDAPKKVQKFIDDLLEMPSKDGESLTTAVNNLRDSSEKKT